MSASTFNITAPMTPGASGAQPGRGAGAGGLVGFDALMNAVFASAEGVLQAGLAGSAQAGAAVPGVAPTGASDSMGTAKAGATVPGLLLDPTQMAAASDAQTGKTGGPDPNPMLGKNAAAAPPVAATAQAGQTPPVPATQIAAGAVPQAKGSQRGDVKTAEGETSPAKDVDRKTDATGAADMTALLPLLA
ncbi:MAG TPA: hypothetical protein VJS38_09725, partial [Phenylobacterium sp.]